jgi:hypothetical protein
VTADRWDYWSISGQEQQVRNLVQVQVVLVPELPGDSQRVELNAKAAGPPAAPQLHLALNHSPAPPRRQQVGAHETAMCSVTWTAWSAWTDGAFHTPKCVVRNTGQKAWVKKGLDTPIRVSVSERITSFRLT